MFPESKNGAYGGGRGGKGTKEKTEKDTVSFSVNTAQKTGRHTRTITRKVRIGEQLEEIADDLQGTAIEDSQKDLLALAQDIWVRFR